MFINAFTNAHHLYLSKLISFQSVPHPTSWKSILILRSHLRLGVSSGPFLSGFHTSPLPIRATLLPLPLVLIRSPNQHTSWGSSLCSLPQSPVTSSLLLGPYFRQLPILKHPHPVLFPQYDIKFPTHVKPSASCSCQISIFFFFRKPDKTVNLIITPPPTPERYDCYIKTGRFVTRLTDAF
jgi:hypothetical protein